MRWAASYTVDSPAAPAAVWSVLLDGRRWSFWHPGIEWLWFEGPIAPGTVVTLKPRRARQTAYVVSDVEAERKLAFGVSFGPVARLDIIFGIEPRGDGSSIAWNVVANGPLASVAAGMLGKRIARDAPAALANLAHYAVDPKQ